MFDLSGLVRRSSGSEHMLFLTPCPWEVHWILRQSGCREVQTSRSRKHGQGCPGSGAAHPSECALGESHFYVPVGELRWFKASPMTRCRKPTA